MFTSTSMFFTTLLLLSCIIPRGLGAVAKTPGRINKCRVKRQGGQVLEVPPNSTAQETSPVSGTPMPSSTQVVGQLPTNTSLPIPTQGTFDGLTLPPFDYANQKVRGVNLGGWFMMEPWITPSMFDNTGNDAIVDEYTFGQYQDRGIALDALHSHWATWYTEQDFIEMQNYGLNHARLPISYWSVPIAQDVGPYVPGAWPYILKALEWANNHGIHIILDLHGAPGSQNGFDNSGQRTDTPIWGIDPGSVEHTLQVLEAIAREVGNKVSIIQLLNEVAGFRGQQWADTAKGFWQAGYDRVRAAAGDNVKVMIGDAFLGLHNWGGYMKASQGVMMDLHVYQIFSFGELERSWDDHITFMCNRKAEFTEYTYNNLWLVMGEWSNAVTDCARYLNGRGVGSRWDNTWLMPREAGALGSCQGWTGSASTFSQEYKNFMRKYWEAQVTVAELAAGWVYWTWKAENADDWSYKAGVENGYIPRDPSERMYPGLCG